MSATLLLASLALQAEPSLEIQREIVVIAKKLKGWRARVGERNGRMFCKTEKSSGDSEIDAIGCTTMAGCRTEHRAQLVTSANRKLPTSQRKALTNAVYDDITKCVFSRRDAAIADLAERRWQARQGTD